MMSRTNLSPSIPLAWADRSSRWKPRRIGKFKLTLSARMNGGAGRADIVVREIEVIPNGREQNLVFNGRLETTVQHELNFPRDCHPRRHQDFRPALSRPV